MDGVFSAELEAARIRLAAGFLERGNPDPAAGEDREVILPYLEPGAYAVINRDGRYIHYADGGEELYDVQGDPNEWENLAANPEFDPVKARLKERAPGTYADPAVKLNLRKHLVTEGESFRWEVK